MRNKTRVVETASLILSVENLYQPRILQSTNASSFSFLMGNVKMNLSHGKGVRVSEGLRLTNFCTEIFVFFFSRVTLSLDMAAILST